MDEKELYTAMTAVLEEEEEEMISLSEFFDIDVGISEYSDNGAEEEESEGSLFSIEINQCYCDHDDRVFVAVGKSESSMHAILWTLKHAITPLPQLSISFMSSLKFDSFHLHVSSHNLPFSKELVPLKGWGKKRFSELTFLLK